MARTLTIRPDAKGRIALGTLARGVSSFQATVDDSGRIILEPFAEIPAREKWLFENKDALNAVRKGLVQSAEGRTQQRVPRSERRKPDMRALINWRAGCGKSACPVLREG